MIPIRAGRLIGLLVLFSAVAASTFAAPWSERTSSVSDQVTALPFRVTDAEFSRTLGAIIAVRNTPNQLAIYDPEARTSSGVNLPAVPSCVGVSPDGLRAVVGHDGWVSEVNLVSRTLVRTFEVGTNVIDVIHGGNGFAYVFGTDDYVRTLDLSTGAQTTTYSWRHPAVARLHPALDRLYAADRYTSPDDVMRFDLPDNQAEFAYDSVYHGDFSFCGNIWISADGLRLFTACGNTFRASSVPEQDIRFAGKLSQETSIQWVTHSAEANSVAVLPAWQQYSSAPRTDNEVHYYAHDSLAYRGKVVLPQFASENKSATSRGRWQFFDASGKKQYVVVQADAGSGIVNDYGVVTIDCTDATVSLMPSTLNAAGNGGQITLDVTGSSGCAWTAQTDAAWLQTTSTGVGNGTVLVNVRPNTTSAAREATITVGNATATISQVPAEPGTVEPPSAITTLPFRVTDAEFSRSLNAIVAVSDFALHIYKTDTRQVTTISLDTPAFCVGVSPDGLHAAVGHSGKITYVDLASATVLKTLDVTTEVFDIVLAGNGYVYAFPKRDQWENIRCVEIATNTETLHTGYSLYAGSVGRLHPGGTWIYSADRGLSPSDIEKYDIAGGTAASMYDSPYHGDYGMCGNLWFSENGTRIYTACGNVFRSTDDPSTDMTYVGKMPNQSIRWASQSAPFGSIAVVRAQSSSQYDPPQDQQIHYYSPDFFAYQGSLLLPSFTSDNASWQSRGRWHFFSADGVQQHIVVQAPAESGMLYDYGVATIDCAGAQVTLSSPSASASADGATLNVSVTGTPGCGWKAVTSNSWLDTLSTGVGDGVVYVTVAANPTSASRTGRVTIANRTFTIVQAGAAVSSLNAKASTPGSVSLTWVSSTTPHHYEVWRNHGSGFALIGSPLTNSFTDASAPPNSALVYRVRAVMSDGSASAFVPDYAHTYTLTDPSLAGVPLRAVHLEEARAIADAIRALAGAPAASYTDPALSGVTAKRVHVTELRTAINAMRASLGMSDMTFSSLPSRPVLAATTQELRNALE